MLKKGSLLQFIEDAKFGPHLYFSIFNEKLFTDVKLYKHGIEKIPDKYLHSSWLPKINHYFMILDILLCKSYTNETTFYKCLDIKSDIFFAFHANNKEFNRFIKIIYA